MPRHRRAGDPQKPTHNKRNLPPIDQRSYLTEKETAKTIGVAHSTLRSWRCQDEKRQAKGLPSLDLAPIFFRSGTKLIFYMKTGVEAWIERHTNRRDPAA